jgi:glycogen debranching enzyme
MTLVDRRSCARASTVRTPESGTLTQVVVGALEQARRDLAALRLHDIEHGDRGWTMAAGLPVYVSLFGRDTLTAAWQAATVSREMMVGTLAELARWQGTEVNDWRDEQPGRMLHQAESGPLALLNVNPLGRYYGSITTSGFYPVIVSELWHWTGDKALVRPFVKPALEGLRWLDQYSDSDRDGFYEYQTRSEQGLRNQGWKDSDDAIVHADGSQAPVPIATCEEQGFVYLAKLHLSELLWWLDEKEEARRLYNEATQLKKRFNEALFTGHHRDADHPFPAHYPNANSPQAWSAIRRLVLAADNARVVPVRTAQPAARRSAPAGVALRDHGEQSTCRRCGDRSAVPSQEERRQ